jgi:hypothetical protein
MIQPLISAKIYFFLLPYFDFNSVDTLEQNRVSHQYSKDKTALPNCTNLGTCKKVWGRLSKTYGFGQLCENMVKNAF